jgi:pseudouridine synthase
MERLQKILSRAGIASRRASERLMTEGRVVVNGEVITSLGSKSDPDRDDIRVDGRRVTRPDRPQYLLLNKPRGYVSTRVDPHRRRTVLDLVATVRAYLYPVGRLDYDSEGLLLLTNDGDLAARLTHPRHGVTRTYEAAVLGVPDERDLRRLAGGVPIDGQRTRPAEIACLRSTRNAATLRITLSEGRNRQIRRMCEAIGHPVTALRRVAIGPLRDANLKPGQWRPLAAAEVARLKRAAGCEEGDTEPRPPGHTARRPRGRSRVS